MRNFLTAATVGAGLLAMGLLAASPGSAERPKDELGRTVAKAIDDSGPVFTDGERAALANKCGFDAGEWEERDIRFDDGVLECGNGRSVEDPEVAAIMANVRQRIRVRVRQAMASAGVAESIRSEVETRLREQRPQIERAVAEARAQLARVDMHKIRREALTAAERAELRADLDRVRIDTRRIREDVLRELDRR
jgi:hypothetical protein